MLGYYSNTGLGLTVSGNVIDDGERMNFYQFTVNPSYDYLRNRDLAAGISFYRHFTKDSLPFYTSPLQNEVNAYFLWRKPFIQPGISVNYGWGSRKEYEERIGFLRYLRARRRGVIIPLPINNISEESIMDFSVTASARHSFYWLNVLSKKDFVRLTPILAFSSGTQRFGFNQTTSTRLTNYTVRNVSLEKNLKFQPLSLTLYLRSDYSIGKFFIQPQCVLDYYFPAEEKNVSFLVSLNAGFVF